MAKNNQKKEKAERNKIYANKHRKRSSRSKFGNRRNSSGGGQNNNSSSS